MQNRPDLPLIVENVLTKHRLAGENQTLILAFSGGSDSSCLLHILQQLQSRLNFKLVCAHLDHQWRQNSAQQAEQCRQICQKYDLSCVVEQASSWHQPKFNNGSKEAAGRMLRRSFLLSLKARLNASAILTAHHQQDQLETFFIRLLRGAGSAGLAAMKEFQTPWLKPLLKVAKADIEAYLAHHQVPFLVDETNTAPEFLRNRLRHQLLPLLTQIDARATSKILDSIAILSQENAALDGLTQSLLTTYQNRPAICLNSFKLAPLAIQNRAILALFIQSKANFSPSNNFLTQANDFLQRSNRPTHQLNQLWQLCKNGQYAWIKIT